MYTPIIYFYAINTCRPGTSQHIYVLDRMVQFHLIPGTCPSIAGTCWVLQQFPILQLRKLPQPVPDLGSWGVPPPASCIKEVKPTYLMS